jgi:hypothetical protein
VLVPAALVFGILCDLEGVAMSVVMPVWRKDIKTIGAALHFSRQMAESGALRRIRSRRRSFGKGRNLAVGGSFGVALVLALGLVLAAPAFAVEAGQVAYVSGSLTVPQGTIGSLDTTSATALVFKFAGAGAGPGEVEIAYKNISGFQYSTEVAHHLGVLPAVAVGLVKRRERKHFFAIKFTDSSGVAQAAIFEVPKHDPPGLLEILRARAPQGCQPQRPACGGLRNNQWGTAQPNLAR